MKTWYPSYTTASHKLHAYIGKNNWFMKDLEVGEALSLGCLTPPILKCSCTCYIRTKRIVNILIAVHEAVQLYTCANNRPYLYPRCGYKNSSKFDLYGVTVDR